jgi:hypothetical protein
MVVRTLQSRALMFYRGLTIGLLVLSGCATAAPPGREETLRTGRSSRAEARCREQQAKAQGSWQAYAMIVRAEAARADAAESLRRATQMSAMARAEAARADAAAREVAEPAALVQAAAVRARAAAIRARAAARRAQLATEAAQRRAAVADDAARDAIDAAFAILPPPAAASVTRQGAEDAVTLQRAAATVAEAASDGVESAQQAAESADEAASSALETVQHVRGAIRDLALAGAESAANFRTANATRDPVERAIDVTPQALDRARAAMRAARAADGEPRRAHAAAMEVPNDPASQLFANAREASVRAFELCGD